MLHAFPLFEMIHNQRELTDVLYSPGGYALQQILVTNPLIAPIWIAGVIYAFLKPALWTSAGTLRSE